MEKIMRALVIGITLWLCSGVAADQKFKSRSYFRAHAQQEIVSGWSSNPWVADRITWTVHRLDGLRYHEWWALVTARSNPTVHGFPSDASYQIELRRRPSVLRFLRSQLSAGH